ncbi:hypothetical protein BaRGS_00013536, partial [Batillaria attramentaria]
SADCEPPVGRLCLTDLVNSDQSTGTLRAAGGLRNGHSAKCVESRLPPADCCRH